MHSKTSSIAGARFPPVRCSTQSNISNTSSRFMSGRTDNVVGMNAQHDPGAPAAPVPELKDVLGTRAALLSPAPTPLPRIGIPGTTPETPADGLRRDAELRENLHGTTQDLRLIADARARAVTKVSTPMAATVLTILTLIGALLLAALGTWIFDIGVAWEVG